MKLAVVGSTKFKDDDVAAEKAAEIISGAFTHYHPDFVLSGGAVGIDSLAAEIAREFGIEVVEYLPEFPRWKPNGYRDRNLLIAQNCTHLLAIRHSASRTYGSGWTADRAEELGRIVHRRTI